MLRNVVLTGWHLWKRLAAASPPLVRQGVYYPGIDLGTTLDDLRAIMRGAGRPLPEEQIDGSFCTSLTVFETIHQVWQHHAVDPRQLRVAVEGFGKVAGGVVRLLAAAGARIVALSTVAGAIASDEGLDVERLLELRACFGDTLVEHYPSARRIDREALVAQDVDLLIPGARPHLIDEANVALVQARWIVPISNAPLTAAAERALIARGVLVMPDFVANCGGILASNALSQGFDRDAVEQIVHGMFARVVARMLKIADEHGQPVTEIARALAWQNHIDLGVARTASASTRLQRVASVVHAEGWTGVWERLAARAYHRWPHLAGAVRQAAVERFAQATLGATFRRASSIADDQLHRRRTRPDRQKSISTEPEAVAMKGRS